MDQGSSTEGRGEGRGRETLAEWVQEEESAQGRPGGLDKDVEGEDHSQGQPEILVEHPEDRIGLAGAGR